jgi:hypothetical protein
MPQGVPHQRGRVRGVQPHAAGRADQVPGVHLRGQGPRHGLRLHQLLRVQGAPWGHGPKTFTLHPCSGSSLLLQGQQALVETPACCSIWHYRTVKALSLKVEQEGHALLVSVTMCVLSGGGRQRGAGAVAGRVSTRHPVRLLPPAGLVRAGPAWTTTLLHIGAASR